MRGGAPRRAAPWWRALLVAATAVLGCTSRPTLPPVVLAALEPPAGIAGVRTAVVARGAGLRLALTSSLGGSGAVADAPQVTLGGVPLEEVVLRSETELAAVIPATLPVGTHDLRIELADGRVATLTAAYVAAPPVTLSLAATPSDLARHEEAQVTLTLESLVDDEVDLSLVAAVATPAEALRLDLDALPALLAPRATVTVGGTLTAIAPDDFAGASGEIQVGARWTLAAATGPSDAVLAVGLLAPARLEATITTPGIVEAGDPQPVTVTLTSASPVPLADLAATLTASGEVALATPVATTGAGLAPGASLTLEGALTGLAPGDGSLTLAASATATRGAAPPPVLVAKAVTVRAGPALVIDPPALPAAVEAGAPFPVVVTVRNTGDVDLDAGELAAAVTGGSVLPGTAPLLLAAGTATSVTLQVVPAAVGTAAVVDLDAGGRSVLSGRPVAAAHVAVTASPALAPAGLEVWATSSDPIAIIDQPLPLIVGVTNPGEVAIGGATVTVTAAAGLTLLDGATPVASLVLGPFAVPGRSTVTTPLTARPVTVGSHPVDLAATGRDALTGATVTATGATVVTARAPLPPEVAIVTPAPGAGRTGAPGTTLAVTVGALGDPGRTLTTISLEVTGPAAVVGSASTAVSLRGTAAQFAVQLDAGAPPGATVTLVGHATDDLGQVGTSLPSEVTVAAAPVLAAVECAPSPLRLFTGLNGEVVLVARYSDGSTRDVTMAAAWSTSAADVATVVGGVVVPGAAGNAVVTGTYDGVGADCTVTVAADDHYNVPARLALGPGGAAPVRHFAVGTPEPVELTVDPGTTWSSADPAIATVSATGLVTGVGSGLVTIDACTNAGCASTEVLVGADLDLPGPFTAGAIAMAGAQQVGTLVVRAGTVVEVVGAPLELTVTTGLIVEAGAVVRADGGNAPGVTMTSPDIPLRAAGGPGAPGGGGGGAGSGGNASNLCGAGNENCGGTGDPPGQNACKVATCGGGQGGGPGGGGGAPPSVSAQAGDAGGGGGHGGAGGRGGGGVAAQLAGAAGPAPGETPLGGGSGGGGGDGSTGSSGSGGGGGGGAGVIRVAALGGATLRIDGLIAARGGRGGGLRAGAHSGPGGGGAGGLIELTAPVGRIVGTGRLLAGGGGGGAAGGSAGPCGGGGGGGGGRVVVIAPVAGPLLAIDVGGGDGGDPCPGGQAGQHGTAGVVQR